MCSETIDYFDTSRWWYSLSGAVAWCIGESCVWQITGCRRLWNRHRSSCTLCFSVVSISSVRKVIFDCVFVYIRISEIVVSANPAQLSRWKVQSKLDEYFIQSACDPNRRFLFFVLNLVLLTHRNCGVVNRRIDVVVSDLSS